MREYKSPQNELAFAAKVREVFNLATQVCEEDADSIYLPKDVLEAFINDMGVKQQSQNVLPGSGTVINVCGGFDVPLCVPGKCMADYSRNDGVDHSGCPEGSQKKGALRNTLAIKVIMAYVPLHLVKGDCPETVKTEVHDQLEETCTGQIVGEEHHSVTATDEKKPRAIIVDPVKKAVTIPAISPPRGKIVAPLQVPQGPGDVIGPGDVWHANFD